LIWADLAVRRHDPAGLGDRLLALLQDRKIGRGCALCTTRRWRLSARKQLELTLWKRACA